MSRAALAPAPAVAPAPARAAVLATLRLRAHGLVLAWALAAVAVAPARAAVLEFVQLQYGDDRLQLQLKMDRGGKAVGDARVFRLENPHRLVLDLPGARSKKSFDLDVPVRARGQITGLRIGRHKEFLRLVLDTADPLQYRLTRSGRQVTLAVELPAPRNSERRPLVLAIDPGHGGRDPGAVAQGLQEKDIALQLAFRLHELLKPLEEFEPHLIRTTDQYISLVDRRRKARKLNADIFLSIHVDAAKNRRVQGASAYVLSLRGASSEAARRLALRENASPGETHQVGGITLEDDEDFNTTVVDLAQTPTIERSLDIANLMLEEIGDVSQVHGDEVGRANFSVLRAPYIPSVLLEAGFLTNKRDAASLVNPRFQRRLMRAVLFGIHRYLRDNPHPDIADGQPPAHFRYRVQKNDTLSQISESYGLSLTRLRKFNDLNGDTIHPGQLLGIPVPQDSKRSSRVLIRR